jgi:hypothetical protein
MRRGLTLAAAFLMTALSKGTVFAEVVPAELVKRTVRLAGKFGPRGASSPDLTGPRPQPPAESAMRFKVPHRIFTWRNVGLVLLAVLSSSIAAGILLSMLDRGGAQAAFSAFVSGRGFAALNGSASCH